MSGPPVTDRQAAAMAADAGRAPSLHNSQPWQFRYARAAREFAVYADDRRRLPRIDPDGRLLRLSCGAAILNLRVTAAARGWRPVLRILPDPAEPDLLATVRLAAPERAGPLARLHGALLQRHTSRYPFWDPHVPDTLRAALRAEAGQEGCDLIFADRSLRDRIVEQCTVAEDRNAADPDRQGDLLRWAHTGATTTEADDDGVPDYAFGPRATGGRAPVRDFARGRPAAPLGATGFEDDPCLALLTTSDDTTAAWVRAGQATQRVLLHGTADALAASPVTQALEWPDLRDDLSAALPETGHVQMVLRLGYGPPGPRTPRRPAGDTLEIVP